MIIIRPFSIPKVSEVNIYGSQSIEITTNQFQTEPGLCDHLETFNEKLHSKLYPKDDNPHSLCKEFAIALEKYNNEVLYLIAKSDFQHKLIIGSGLTEIEAILVEEKGKYVWQFKRLNDKGLLSALARQQYN